MKQVFLLATCLLGLLTGPLAPGARAQCVISPPPAGCPQPFRVVDVATGQEVQSLCVGQAVRFEPACGRVVPATQLYYSALPGTNTTPTGCSFASVALPGNTYTPTIVGAYTIAELSNLLVGGITVGTVYVRNFQVYDAPAPRFTLTPCPGGNTRVYIDTTLPTAPYDQYFIQVGSGPLLGPLSQGALIQTVAAPAGSQVTVIGSYRSNTLCSSQTTKTVPVFTSLPLLLSRLTVQGALPGPITFTLSGLTDYHRSDIQRADPAAPTRFLPLAVLTTPTSYSYNSAPAGLYRLASYDICGLDSAFSESVPTLELSGASANNVNTLTWRTAGPVASYTLLRNGVALTPAPAPGATSYTDAAVVCGTRYTYQLQGTTAGGSQTISAEAPVQTVSTLPPPAPLLNASFDLLGRVELTATLPGGAALPAGSTLRFSRQGGGQDLTFAPGPNPTRLRDSTALASLLASPPCYAAVVQDICGNSSATSSPTCPSLLAAAAADPEGRSAQLAWSAFRGPGSPGQPASYRVLSLAADGTVLAASAATSALSYLDLAPPADRQILRYRVEASGAGLPPGTVSYSNVATITRRPVLAVPNAFTPNGDGLNDVLELKGRYLAAFTFVVVDRNGQEVFRATDRGQTWDGTIRGHAPVNAAYVWRFTMTDEAGQPFSQTGSVSVLK